MNSDTAGAIEMSTPILGEEIAPPPSRVQRAVAVLRFALGVVFVGLGIIGSLLPIIQGWVFFLLALVMFFPDHPRVEKALQRATPKFPRLVRFLRKIGAGTQDTPKLAQIEVSLHHSHHDG